MKQKALMAIALAFILLSAPVFGETGIWTENKHDGANTSAVGGVGDMKDGNLVEKWRFGPVGTFFSWNFVGDITGNGENDVITSANHTIVALDGENGKVVWNYTDASFYDENESVYPTALSLVKIGERWDIIEGHYPHMLLSYGEKNPVWEIRDYYQKYYGFHWVGVLYSGGNAYGVLEEPDIYSGYPSYSPAPWAVGNSSILLLNMSDSKVVWQKNFPLFAISAGIGDINGDSSDDIILTGLGKGAKYSVLMALDINGNEEWNVTGNFSGDSVYIGDITGDTVPEIILGNTTSFFCFNNRGDLLWKTQVWERPHGYQSTQSAGIVPGRGIVCTTFGSGYFYFIDSKGTLHSKNMTSLSFESYPVIADIDGDGSYEVLEIVNEKGNKTLRSIDPETASIEWEHSLSPSTGSGRVSLSPFVVVADVDSDGKLEILVVEGVDNDKGYLEAAYLVCLEHAHINGSENSPLPIYVTGIALILAVAAIFYMKKRKG